MASGQELEYYNKAGYEKLLDELLRVRYERPEAYEAVAEVARNYRGWVTRVTGIQDLPEVPSK